MTDIEEPSPLPHAELGSANGKASKSQIVTFNTTQRDLAD